MNEPEVLSATHRFLGKNGIGDSGVVQMYTDAHMSLMGIMALRPFQRFTVELDDQVVHPDLVGRLQDGSYFAVEAKGSSDLLNGISQAARYQRAFHHVYLAADEAACGSAVRREVQERNVGLFAVRTGVPTDSSVIVLNRSHLRQPYWIPFEAIRAQFSGVEWAIHRTLAYNIPTHALSWCIALPRQSAVGISEARECIGTYPMPKFWRKSLDDATRLGLVGANRQEVSLTDIGRAVGMALPHTLDEWCAVHAHARSVGGVLASISPTAGATLRLLLLHDPMVRHLISGLRDLADATGTFPDLARACDAIDSSRTPPIFLLPEASARLANQRGRIQWHLAQATDWRTSTYMQWKSFLKHAGILAPSPLGASSSKHYLPERDIWTLAPGFI